MESRGMRINRVKTEWMKCAFGEEDRQEVDVEIDMETINEVQFFKYLGSLIQRLQSNGEMDKEIGNRKKSRWSNWRKCQGVMTDKRISIRMKKKVFTAVIRSALTYGVETWATSVWEEEQMNVTKMRMLRLLCEGEKER